MFKKTKRYLVTGGCGFIGSAMTQRLLRLPKTEVINLDKLTYSASLKSLLEFNKNPRHLHLKIDLADAQTVSKAIDDYRPDVIIHLAAESHVDNSISQPDPFIQSNIIGTYNLLTAALNLWQKSTPHLRFHHVSTDEVFGSLGDGGSFSETSNYAPNSPYSASKAAADHLVSAWHKTYGLPVTLSQCSNNYGPHQHHEKLIPTVIRSCLQGHPIPVYGTGHNIRDWVHVDDHVDALLTILEKGKISENYMIGGETELKNIDLVHQICDYMDTHYPASTSYKDLITFVDDRLGHDYRYSADISKIQHDLGWRPTTFFDEGIAKTIRWHVKDYYTTHQPNRMAQ